jgi:hypothetical protein
VRALLSAPRIPLVDLVVDVHVVVDGDGDGDEKQLGASLFTHSSPPGNTRLLAHA